jgi:hypothetical protein
MPRQLFQGFSPLYEHNCCSLTYSIFSLQISLFRSQFSSLLLSDIEVFYHFQSQRHRILRFLESNNLLKNSVCEGVILRISASLPPSTSSIPPTTLSHPHSSPSPLSSSPLSSSPLSPQSPLSPSDASSPPLTPSGLMIREWRSLRGDRCGGRYIPSSSFLVKKLHPLSIHEEEVMIVEKSRSKSSHGREKLVSFVNTI